MAAEPWRSDFPDSPHEPQNLDLVRRHLCWTPAERLENLRRVYRFVARAKQGRWHDPRAGESSKEPQCR
jgi:hypothetical protein